MFACEMPYGPTLYFSLAKRMEALWNLHRGFLGSMLIALFRVLKHGQTSSVHAEPVWKQQETWSTLVSAIKNIGEI